MDKDHFSKSILKGLRQKSSDRVAGTFDRGGGGRTGLKMQFFRMSFPRLLQQLLKISSERGP